MFHSNQPFGTLVISVDLPCRDESPAGRVGDELLRMMRARHVPATWAVSRADALTDQLVRESAGHDVALLGDASWVGAAAGRTRFARELAARTTALRRRGGELAAIVLRDVSLTEHLDLLVKHRISLIRAGTSDRPQMTPLQPQSLRFGVWLAPVWAVIPRTDRWSWLGAAPLVRQAARRAAQSGGVAHLVVDAERLAARPAAVRELDGVISDLARQRDRGLLKIRTMSELSQRLTRRRATSPARSVLRAA